MGLYIALLSHLRIETSKPVLREPAEVCFFCPENV